MRKYGSTIAYVVLVQLILLYVFFHAGFSMWEERSKFAGTDAFQPVSAELYTYQQRKELGNNLKSILYDIVYRYEVNGVIYKANFSGQTSLEETKIIYYNPYSPSTYSQYRSYNESMGRKMLYSTPVLVIAIFFQISVIRTIVQTIHKSRAEDISNHLYVDRFDKWDDRYCL